MGNLLLAVWACVAVRTLAVDTSAQASNLVIGKYMYECTSLNFYSNMKETISMFG